MQENEKMNGSIEVISNNVSKGMVVRIRSIEDVAIVVEAGQSLTDVQPVDVPEGVTADAAWTATTADGFPAQVFFREDRDDVPPAMEPEPVLDE
jgi:hypothetical protein